MGRPSPRPRWRALVLTTAVAAGMIGWLARAPYRVADPEGAVLRLSWRLRGEAGTACRPRTEAELIALPEHMRTPEVCDRRPVAYRLTVRLDDGPVDTSVLVSGGVRGDRPVFVLRDTVIAPGAHRVVVGFEQTDSGGADSPVQLSIDTVLRAQAGAIDLITLDAEARRLVHRAPLPP